jgi:hypothetical protein
MHLSLSIDLSINMNESISPSFYRALNPAGPAQVSLLSVCVPLSLPTPTPSLSSFSLSLACSLALSLSLR